MSTYLAIAWKQLIYTCCKKVHGHIVTIGLFRIMIVTNGMMTIVFYKKTAHF